MRLTNSQELESRSKVNKFLTDSWAIDVPEGRYVDLRDSIRVAFYFIMNYSLVYLKTITSAGKMLAAFCDELHIEHMQIV